jgi:hypothetical protein
LAALASKSAVLLVLNTSVPANGRTPVYAENIWRARHHSIAATPRITARLSFRATQLLIERTPECIEIAVLRATIRVLSALVTKGLAPVQRNTSLAAIRAHTFLRAAFIVARARAVLLYADIDTSVVRALEATAAQPRASADIVREATE